MSRNISKLERIERTAVIRDALIKGLPPLFRVHRELLERADPSSFVLELCHCGPSFGDCFVAALRAMTKR
jgi:hypothetical protein